MLPFSSRGSQYDTIAPEPKGLPNFKDFEKSDVNLKIWLPQILVDRVNWLSKKRDVSRPDVIRGLLFEHLYGGVAYDALVKFVADARAEGELALARHNFALPEMLIDRSIESRGLGIRFSTTRNTQVDLEHIGKSVDDLDVTLPTRLKADLAALALKHHLTASSYVRKMLVLQLLGEQVHTSWQDAVGAISKDVLAIEKD